MKIDCLTGRRYQIFFVFLHLQTVSYWLAEKSAFRLIPPSEEIYYFDGYSLMLKFSDEKYTYRLESPEAGNLYFDGVELKKVEVE